MTVRRERRGFVEIITLDRPEARNAFDPEQSRAVEAALDDINANDEIRAAVITGTGPVFSAGADLKVAATPRAPEIVTERGGFGGIVKYPLQKVLIAAVNGIALGGGFEITLACDMVVASEESVFGLPEVKRGVFAGGGGLVRLPRRVPRAIALEIITTGQPITAARAYELGLVNRVVAADQVLDEAVALAELVAENAPISVRVSRRIARAAADLTEEQAWALQDELRPEVSDSADRHEGLRAFAEKRPPVWTGR